MRRKYNDLLAKRAGMLTEAETLLKDGKREDYLHDVFTHNYGQDLQSLIGEAYGDDIRQSEAIRCIREALEINPYIKAVHQISVRFEGSTLHLSFKAKTIYGEVILNDGKIAL